ncbi:histidine--tRNA ligase [Buchnera aphidicola]|uniref:Histidine--tRNA ligase n=1 Tax=Buchnera aphidicola (Stegophylla sp.) TaxID=2315800 RepID=A0A4D6YKJ3_9GAMM|nr:histidine--tRNA ligase [Buchnera aphidicola (Stegophylla sp.)]QCI26360.1 histidine--tRNA ligase [Buchnera aphidicola (Stegophylla sp.)]
MNNNTRSIRGMHDYLPKELIGWNTVECALKKILLSYNYFEIRLPILEKTVLFQKTIGNITDIMQKEMYSFYDKNNNSLTLRPEATSSCVRAVIQHNLLYHQTPRLWYYGPMFRYERPQKGRYRQFYQFGIEVFGLSEPNIELELILLITRFWNILGISDLLTLEINSIGSIQARIKYQMVLQKFFNKHRSYLDQTSLLQLDKNPIRILDSKNKNIQKLLINAPRLSNYIDSKTMLNFHHLCKLMDHFKIKYVINHHLIRGIDYYNNTVFEWKTNHLGAQNTICAGGRYDTLVQQLGGTVTPAIGLAIGMDRLLLLMQTLFMFSQDNNIIADICIFFSHPSVKLLALSLSEEIRNIMTKLKILLEFQPVQLLKIFRNLKKYSCRIILFLELEEIQKNLIYLIDLKNKCKRKIFKISIIQELSAIFYSI